MRRAERPVDEHLDRDAGGRIEAFHLRWPAGSGQLRFVEMTDACAIGGESFGAEERIDAIVSGAGLRRLHLEPSRRPGACVLPGMQHARGDQAEIAGAERVRLVADLNRWAARQNVEALLKRVHVRVHSSARVQETNPCAHVNRSHCAIYVGSASEPVAVLLVGFGRLCRGWVDLGDSVHSGGSIMALIYATGDGRMVLAGSSLL